MQRSSDDQIQSTLARYLRNELSLSEFKDWLVGAMWDVDQTGNANLIELSYDIRLALAEFDDDQDVNRLRRQLQSLLVDSAAHIGR